MPYAPKGWTNFPSVVTQIDAGALTGMESRAANYVGAQEIGPGVAAQPDFVVTQAGGGSMTVNVGSVGLLMRASIPLDANGGTQRYEYSGAQLTGLVTAANATNPRIDIVTLAPPASPDSIVPQVIVIAGTPTAGAALFNRTGAPALPPGRILLADILVPANATQILTAQIRDRRAYFMPSVPTGILSAIDTVTPEPSPGISTGLQTITAGSTDNRSAAILMWLPRRILAARIRWSYKQGATPAATVYNWFLGDASGRFVGLTANQNFTGGANSLQARNEALTAPVQLEAGALWVVFVLASMTASSTVTFNGATLGQASAAGGNVAGPNIGAVISGSGVGNASIIDAGMVDAIGGSLLAAVPQIQIGA